MTRRSTLILVALTLLSGTAIFAAGGEVAPKVLEIDPIYNEPSKAEIDADPNIEALNQAILEPMTSATKGGIFRVPHTNQSFPTDGLPDQTNIIGGEAGVVFENALAGANGVGPAVQSMLGHDIDHVASPNDDMRAALQALVIGAATEDQAAMDAAASDLRDILLGCTEGRLYDGFSMLNINRFKPTAFGDVPLSCMPENLVPGEYKMKVATDTGQTFTSPFDGEERKIWEVDINTLYYDGQIDADTFLVKFPMNEVEGFHHGDDLLYANYRIYSLAEEDFSPTLVMLDRRLAQNTVSFPFRGMDHVWVAFGRGFVLNLTVKYPPLRMIRGVYNWGWRVHPPRIHFLQPIYEMIVSNPAHPNFGESYLDPQGQSFAIRNREEMTVGLIADEAPEKKMYQVAKAVLVDGIDADDLFDWLTDENEGPRGTWLDWADLAKEQRQIPEEAWEKLAQEDGLARGEFGEYKMLTVFMNNEMYGEGPFLNEIDPWQQGEIFRVKLINFDKHTHYFRNVDFGTRLHDDVLRCCGGGETSFEIMNFKPSYGAPKVAEMQWRAGWGFRPHYDVIQQPLAFARGSDRARVKPYQGGLSDKVFYGYQFSQETRRGDFRFSPPPFVITDTDNPAPFRLRESDGSNGLVIGTHTEGYGNGFRFCPDAPFPGFCPENITAANPRPVLNWPPPFGGQELRFPPFLRNPRQDGCEPDEQGLPVCDDIIPPTGAWRPFLWLNPQTGTIFLPGKDESCIGDTEPCHQADLTGSHGATIFAGNSLSATVELPRASGQVFYQFDDLFHDNSIFSPHPLSEGEDLTDSVKNLRAFVRNDTLRVRGRLNPFLGLESADANTNTFADWVSIYAGGLNADGKCEGPHLGSASVNEDNGGFVLRCGNDCFNRTPDLKASPVSPGDQVCVQSTVSAAFAVTVD